MLAGAWLAGIRADYGSRVWSITDPDAADTVGVLSQRDSGLGTDGTGTRGWHGQNMDTTDPVRGLSQPPVESFDAIVVGASFAGLAAATQLAGSGRVLLADREPIGGGQTSACGAPLAVLERLDALDALEQVHPTVVINTARRRITIRPEYPFATFDYRALCEILAARLDGVELAVAPFRDREVDGTLVLGDRRVRAPVVIDASGWRAVVARKLGAAPPERSHLSIGLDARHDHGGCAMEFWIRPAGEPSDVIWAFPAGDHVREGTGAYAGRGSGLKSSLQRLPHERDLPARAVYGGFFPSRLGDPVAGAVFVVGDAAGQCLPLTGEGIRPALVWGQVAGRWARRVVQGTTGLDDAWGAYRAAVVAHSREYAILERLQAGLQRMPLGLVPAATRLFGAGPLGRLTQRAYWRAADPDLLVADRAFQGVRRFPVEQCATGPVAAKQRRTP